MRIGVAGVGRIGTMHAANLTALSQVDEVLLYDPVPGRYDGCIPIDQVGRRNWTL